MFHRVNDPSTGCDPLAFSHFLRNLIHHFPIVKLADPLPHVPLAIMLTFDDAYFDFYDTVFPLLQHHRVPALLAVSAKYSVDDTSLHRTHRLAVPYPHGMEADRYIQDVPFCTWKELREMSQSPYVTIASHGYAHANFTDPNSDLHQEIVLSKHILEHKLDQKITSLVYPYGKMTPAIHQKVREHYHFGIRIGSALNYGWDHSKGQLYRIDADHLWKNHRAIDKHLIRQLSLKYWLNRLRGK